MINEEKVRLYGNCEKEDKERREREWWKKKKKGGWGERDGDARWIVSELRKSPVSNRKSHPSRSIEEQRQRLLLVGISILEFLPRKKSCKRHHCVLHVHDASLLLVNVGGVDDQALQLVQLQ